MKTLAGDLLSKSLGKLRFLEMSGKIGFNETEEKLIKCRFIDRNKVAICEDVCCLSGKQQRRLSRIIDSKFSTFFKDNIEWFTNAELNNIIKFAKEIKRSPFIE